MFILLCRYDVYEWVLEDFIVAKQALFKINKARMKLRA